MTSDLLKHCMLIYWLSTQNPDSKRLIRYPACLSLSTSDKSSTSLNPRKLPYVIHHSHATPHCRLFHLSISAHAHIAKMASLRMLTFLRCHLCTCSPLCLRTRHCFLTADSSPFRTKSACYLLSGVSFSSSELLVSWPTHHSPQPLTIATFPSN
jgi:hypothetical protein